MVSKTDVRSPSEDPSLHTILAGLFPMHDVLQLLLHGPVTSILLCFRPAIPPTCLPQPTPGSHVQASSPCTTFPYSSSLTQQPLLFSSNSSRLPLLALAVTTASPAWHLQADQLLLVSFRPVQSPAPVIVTATAMLLLSLLHLQ